jgi:hypothetical protein
MGPPRPGPLLNRPREDKCSQQPKPPQVNRGAKNRGRPSRLCCGVAVSTQARIPGALKSFSAAIPVDDIRGTLPSGSVEKPTTGIGNGSPL